MCHWAVRGTSQDRSSVDPRARHLRQCRAREDRQTRASTGVWSVVPGFSGGPGSSGTEFKCQLSWFVKGKCQK